MLGAVLFWRGFVFCSYKWLACLCMEGSRLKVILSAFGVTGDEPQGGFPARMYGTRPRGSTEPCQAAGKLRPAQPGASLPFSGMLPAFCINFPGPPRLFPKTNRAHTQQRTAGIAALGAKGWGLGFGSFF